MRRFLLSAAAVLALLTAPAQADEDCQVVDWMAVPLPDGPPVEVALETAYPGVRVEGGKLILPAEEGQEPVSFDLGTVRDIPPGDRLRDSTIAEMFLQPYPLDFDLTPRRTPWLDPGRLRHQPFFRAWYGDRKSVVYRRLERAVYNGLRHKPKFAVNGYRCVHVQLQAALDEIADIGIIMDRYFAQPGGSFAWRKVPGLRAYSPHSYAIAIDIDRDEGQYWRWTGAAPGEVGPYENKIPRELVEAFERYGFIWGGKWHHYDGMHFEYRPELILFTRAVTGRR